MVLTRLRKALNFLKHWSAPTVKIFIALVTGAIHQITTIIVYRCPCVNPDEFEEDCSNPSAGSISECSQLMNFFYGITFVAGPAISLFLLGLALQTKLWKLVTGWWRKIGFIPGESRFRCKSLIEVISVALISPLTWICIALLDGRHLACAYTPIPYDVGFPGSQFTNCFDVSRFVCISIN